MEHLARVPKDIHGRQGRAHKARKLTEGWNVPNRRKAWFKIKYKMQLVRELLFQYILNIVWEGEGLEMKLETWASTKQYLRVCTYPNRGYIHELPNR